MVDLALVSEDRGISDTSIVSSILSPSAGSFALAILKLMLRAVRSPLLAPVVLCRVPPWLLSSMGYPSCSLIAPLPPRVPPVPPSPWSCNRSCNSRIPWCSLLSLDSPGRYSEPLVRLDRESKSISRAPELLCTFNSMWWALAELRPVKCSLSRSDVAPRLASGNDASNRFPSDPINRPLHGSRPMSFWLSQCSAAKLSLVTLGCP
mmetsp:Transcript_29577/g.56833  ORF Transcript_29577/g.56833 Transcript_29577/m.56833 type:complete len:206 (+) Transcript_29577:536-1153(+)